MFDVLSSANDKDKMYKILKENGPVDSDTAMLLGELIHIKGVDDYFTGEGKEKIDMCKAFEDFKEEGRQEGRQETLRMAIEMGKSLGVSLQIMIEKVSVTFGISEEEASKKIEAYW